MQKIFYIADYHLGHSNVIRFDNRPFSNIQEMNEKLISNWNQVVSKNDIVYVLGDFIWSKESEWSDILNHLKGQIVLIKGNHDPRQFSAKTKSYFSDIKDYKEINDDGSKVILCHYPIPFYRGDYQENVWMLYGHIHVSKENDQLEEIRRIITKNSKSNHDNKCHFINVGCMMPWMNYYPRNLSEIIEGFNSYMEDKK